jgi:hypothetical protein
MSDDTTNTAPVLLGRAAILAAADLPTRDVQVPEWGGAVRIQALTGAAREALGKAAQQAGAGNFQARLVAASVVDEAGQRLFTDADLDALGAKSAAALQRVFDAAQDLNAIGPSAVEPAGKG